MDTVHINLHRTSTWLQLLLFFVPFLESHICTNPTAAMREVLIAIFHKNAYYRQFWSEIMTQSLWSGVAKWQKMSSSGGPTVHRGGSTNTDIGQSDCDIGLMARPLRCISEQQEPLWTDMAYSCILGAFWTGFRNATAGAVSRCPSVCLCK